MSKYCKNCGMATHNIDGVCETCAKKGIKPTMTGITRRSHF